MSIKSLVLLITVNFSFPVLGCQSPVGTWSILNEEEISNLTFMRDGSGEYYYEIGEDKYSEKTRWKIITPQKRELTDEEDSYNYRYETNVIELIFYDSETNEEASLEYFLCTDDRLVGQIKGLGYDTDVYMYKRR